MKTLLLALALISGATALAAPPVADMESVILKCSPAVLHPDAGMSATITVGGFAGLTELHISRFFLGHTTQDMFIVHELQTSKLGAPRVYSGEKVQLAVQLTIAPRNNKYPATLTMQEGKEVTSEKLLCEKVN